ncbi:MAG: exodeoxyribonuclease VII small subunit [Planctomycetes bacterium]|nr:exodeoxyribonuclease VII small subunit [Planctomycetota bacterium]
MAKRKKTEDEPSGPQECGFDEQLSQLEALVAELESGDLSLEEAMERFSTGVKLLGSCREALSGYEERVEELSAQAEAGLSELGGEEEEE